MRPLISIVIPTYNSALTLPICLESLVIQNFENFELVIIDGQSTDGTIEIINNYKLKFERFQYISEKDKGIYDAMNKGIGMAQGEWLYFLGSDDTLINATIIEKVAAKISINNPIDIIYGDVNSTFYDGRYDGKFTYEKLTRINICHQAIFFNRRVFNAIGDFDLKYKVVADWDHNIRWFFNDRIKNKYIDLVIANFADGGFSAQNEDVLFEKNKNFILLRLGFFKLSFFELRRLVTIEFEKIKETKSIVNYSYLSLFLLVIRGKRKWNHLINKKA